MIARSNWKPASAILAGILLLAWFTTLRPIAFGGDTSYIKVAGDSMEPAFYGGDLVVIRKRDQYHRGDVIAYSVGTGVVIHRIIGGDAESGFVTIGDNRPNTDIWRPKQEDIIGSQSVRVPALGTLTSLLQHASVLALATFGSVVWLFAGTTSHQRRRRT